MLYDFVWSIMEVLSNRIRCKNTLLIYLSCWILLDSLLIVEGYPNVAVVSPGGKGGGGGGGSKGGGNSSGKGGGGSGTGTGKGSATAPRYYGGYYYGGGSGGVNRHKSGDRGRGSNLDYLYAAATIAGLAMLLSNALSDLSQISQQLLELYNIVNMIKNTKISDLVDLLKKADCSFKAQWRDCISSENISNLIGVKQSSIMTLILVSMMNCPASQVHASRMIYFLGYFGTSSVRDVTEVMVTVSETAQLHDDFVRDYEFDYGIGATSIEYDLADADDIGIHGDIKNVCFELLNRKPRGVPTDGIDINAEAKDLRHEMTQGNGPWKRTGWKDNRQKLDYLMIELPFDPLRKIMDEFKNVNDGQTIDDALSEHMADDANKLTAYRQELQLARDKIVYLVEEIQTRITDNQEYSLPLANAIVMLATIPKTDQDKVDAEYKKRNNNVGLLEQLDKMSTTTGLEDVIAQAVKSYIKDLRDRTQ